ncbi:MAG: hypothetical protein WCG12_07495 [Alcaligenaceae bacterium]
MVKVVGRAYAWVICGGLSLFVLGGLLVAGMLQGPSTSAQQLRLRTERAALQQERSELETERTQATSQFNQAQRALLTERATRLELEKILASLQLELGRTQDQLAFFEDLLPPGPRGAVDIRAVDVRPHAEGLHYRVLLMRSGKATRHFVGALQFVAKGYCLGDGEAPEQTIILQPLLAKPLQAVPEGGVSQSQHAQTSLAQSPGTQATGTQVQGTRPQGTQPQGTQLQQAELQQTEAQQAALRLDFAQFQRGQGLLAIPPGFAPKTVTVRVLDGDIVLASKVVAL